MGCVARWQARRIFLTESSNEVLACRLDWDRCFCWLQGMAILRGHPCSYRLGRLELDVLRNTAHADRFRRPLSLPVPNITDKYCAGSNSFWCWRRTTLFDWINPRTHRHLRPPAYGDRPSANQRGGYALSFCGYTECLEENGVANFRVRQDFPVRHDFNKRWRVR